MDIRYLQVASAAFQDVESASRDQLYIHNTESLVSIPQSSSRIPNFKDKFKCRPSVIRLAEPSAIQWSLTSNSCPINFQMEYFLTKYFTFSRIQMLHSKKGRLAMASPYQIDHGFKNLGVNGEQYAKQAFWK